MITTHHNLPIHPSSFIGRARELAAIEQLLNTARLITLTGVGGIGKTRLAHELALRHWETFEHGAFIVNLAPLSSPSSIVPAIAETVGLALYAGSEPQAQLLNYLHDKQLLLVLDNFEHLLSPSTALSGTVAAVSDGATLVSAILVGAPRIQLVVTSRERLQLQEEQIFGVDGLEFPAGETLAHAAQYDAVNLFVQSAQRVQPNFFPAEPDLTVLARICRLAQGMPLAIELSAAWVQMLSLEEIFEEMVGTADFLESELRNVPERQRSIRAVFNSSWRLLTEPEREVFKRLAAFRAGCSREAAQLIAGASLRELSTLVNKSLLTRRPSGRYEIHELLRQYAEEQLKQSPALRAAVLEQHSAYYLHWIQQRSDALKDRRLPAMLNEMDAEIENARAAWEYAVAHGQSDRLAQAIDALMRYFERRGRLVEGHLLCRLLTTRDGIAAPTLAHAKALTWQGAFATQFGRLTDARDDLQASLNILETLQADPFPVREARALSLWHFGIVARYLGPFETAVRCFDESLGLARQVNDDWLISNVLNELGFVHYLLGLFGEAQQYADESLRLQRMIGEPFSLAEVLSTCGHIAEEQGLLNNAEEHFSAGLQIYRGLNDRAGVARLLGEFGGVLSAAGRFVEAKGQIAEGLGMFVELGLRRPMALWRAILGYSCLALGEYAQAQSECEQALMLTNEIHYVYAHALALADAGCLYLARGVPATALTYCEQAIQIYRRLHLLARLATVLVYESASLRLLGQTGAANAALGEAFPIAVRLRHDFARSLAFGECAVRWAQAGEIERAIAIRAFTLQQTPLMRAQYIADVWGRAIEAAAMALPPEALAAAQARGRSLTVEQAIAEVEQVMTVRETAPTPPTVEVTPGDPNALTQRELEVLRLVAQRLTDAEIAAKLVISPRTVNTHLTAIYGKLGVNSRRAAAQHALAQKLL